MDAALLSAENRTLKAALADRDSRIESLEFELVKLKQLVFGARSERLQTFPDSAQLRLWDEQPEDLPLASPVEFKTVVKSPVKNAPKRTALPDHLPREIVVLPLSAEERACLACGEERPLIGYESSEWLDYVPAQLKVPREMRLWEMPRAAEHRAGAAAGDRTGDSDAGAAGLRADGQVRLSLTLVPDRTSPCSPGCAHAGKQRSAT